jgi:RHS repeat-associated protein
MSYFPWCNGAFKLYGYFSPANGRGYNLYGGLIVSNFATWEASNNVIPRDERWQTYTNNQWGGFMGYFANPEYRSWELMPVRVLDLPGTVRSISMGSGLRNYPNGRAFGMAEGEPEMGQFMATDEDGKLWQWGYDAYGMFGRIFSLAQTNRVFTNSIDADPNYLHNFPSQRAVAWGSETPEGWTNRGILPVIALPSAYRVPSLTNGPSQSFDDIQSVCGNAFLRLALKQDGSLWSWGDKMLIGRPQDINHPNIFTNLQFYFNWLDGVTNDVVAFIGGENYPVYDWLYNYYWWYYDQNYGGDVLPGRVNIPGNDAAGIIPGRKIVDVQSTPYASLARCQDGSIWFFGRNAYASIYETTWRPAEWSLNPYDPNSLDQLPFIERDETKPWKPVCIASLGSTNGEANPIIQTSVADGHWVFLRADGTVIEWGFVPNLVDPDYSSFWRVYNSKDPVPVQFPQGIGIASVAAANEYSVAVDENGSVWAWGLINHKHVLNPIPLPLKNISKVVCAGNTVLALDKKGSVWGWGYIGTHGLLQVPPENGGAWMVAVGRYTDRSIEPGFKTRPVRINGIENVSDIFAGGESAFAIGEKEDGKPVHLAGTGLDQGAKLVWDSYPGAGQYNVYRSLDKDSGYILIGTATQTAYVDGGPMTIPGQNALKSQPLVNGQTYYYKVSAVVNGVETAKSREAEVSPQPVPSQVPNVSLTLKCRSVVINWTVCTNADQSSPVEYRVERAKNGGDIFEPMFHYAPEWGTNVVTMQYEDSEITTNTHYAYRVIAVNDAGQSLPSNILTVDTADGNCTEAPQMIPPGQAYFRRIQHYNNGGSSSDDSDGGILLGDGADSSSGGGGSSTGGGSGVDFTDTFGEAQLTWTYSVNDSTNITAFRFRYHYAEQGHQKVAEYVQNVAVTDVTLDSSDNLFKHYRYNLRILPQKQCTITVSAIRNGEESRSSDSVTVVADDSNWSEKTRLRAVPGYQQVYLDWPDSDLIYSYDVLCTAWPLWEPPWSGSGIGVDSLNVDNSVTIGKDLLDTRVWHTGLSSSNITTADIMSLRDLTARLTDTNDLVGQWLWNQFAPTSQRIVTNYQAHAGSWADAGIVATKQLVVDQLNAMIQGGVILLTPAQLTQLNLSTNGDFSLRTRQDMQRQALATIANPFTANDVAELNRYMLEDLFAGQIARMGEPMVGEYVSAEIAPNSISDVWSLLTLLTNTNNSNAVAISNAMHSVVDLENYSEPVWPNPFDPVEYRATTVAMRNVMARGLTAAIQNTNLDLDCDAVTNRFTSRTLNLYVNRTNLDVNARSLMNRLILQELGDWGWFFAPMTGQRYYVLVGNTYDGGNFKNPYWVAAQPSKTASPPQALSLNAQTFPYSSMVLVQWYIPGKTNYVVGSGTNWQFYVERKSGSDPYSLLAAAGFGLSYLDQDVVNDTTYTYRVTAMDQDYNRLQAEVSGTPTYSSALTLLPPVAGNGYVNLAWTPVRAASFTVQHSLDQVNFDSVGILNNGDAYKNADSHFRHVPVQNGVQHYYRIQGLTPTGIKFYSDVKSAVPLATLPPLPPDEFNVSLTLSPDGVGARAMFTWTPKSGADHYQVFVRQGGALTPIYDGRAMYCSYDIPLNTPDDTTLLFDIRCVTADNQYGETKEITCKYSKWEIDAKSGETPPLQLVVAGTLSQAFTNDVIGPTNLTLGVVTSLKLKRISFYDQREDGRHLIGQADSEPFVFNWMQPKGGNHYVTASAEVLMGDNPASGTAPVALMNSDPAVFRLIIKPELAAYTASATDLQLPGLGMPISIGRSYSSHGTGTNLLGVGWSPNWNGGKITFSTPLAAGWIGSTGMFLGQVTMYSVGSDTNHEASVNLPSGESVPFWIGIDGQTQNNPINGGVNSINAKLIFGNYDSIGGTLTGNGSSQVDVVAAMASGTEWIKAPLTLHDSSWDDWGGTPSPGADLIAFGAFTYTSSDNTQYLYDRPVGTDGLSWLLTSITDRNGNSLHYVYGDGTTTAKPLDQIIAITNSCGRGVKFRYDSGVGYTNIIVSDAFGDDVLKYCVTNCQLRAVWRRTERPTVPPNPNPNPWEITRYNYGTSVDDTNRIVEAYDQRGVRVVANSYMSATNEETAGNLFRQTNIANSVTTYNLSNYVLTVVQTVGGVSKVIKVVNDDSGAIVGVTTPVIGTNAPTALTVTNTYDERGRLIAQRDALGGLKTFSYDAQDHLTGQSDANGNSTSSEVNSFGEPTTSTDANGNVATSQYDDAGNPTKVTDPSGTVTISEYSDLFTATSGKVLGRRLHRELRNAPGVPYTLVTIYSYIGEADSEASSPAFGDVKSTTEEWGLADDVNNVSVVGTPVTVTYQYDANGNRTNEIKTRLLASGTETISSQSRYDAANRVLASQVKSSIGGILQTSGVVFNPLGKQSVSADGAGRTTASTYDYAGNLIETLYPDGTVSRTAYTLDGHPEWVQDRTMSGTTTVAPGTKTTYDASGRAVKVERYASMTMTSNSATAGMDYFGPANLPKMTASFSGAALTTTRTFYDELGRVPYKVDARGNVTAKVFDAGGRVTNTLTYVQVSGISDTTAVADITLALSTNAPVQSTSYGFDANGNQTVVTDALGHSITNVYDKANRVVETDYPDTGLGKRARFTRYNGLGQRVQETDENGVITKYTYDFRGLLTSVTLAAETDKATTTTYAYDELGNEVSQRDANNHATTFAYDALGRRISRTLPDGQKEGYGYDNVKLTGNLLYQTNFNGVVITNQYDFASGRLTNCSAPGYVALYTYNPTNGLRTQMGDRSGFSFYDYDTLGRLARVRKVWPNPAGIGFNVLRSINYGYDQLGSLTNMWADGFTNVYRYDALGRLTNVLADSVSAAGYNYDAVGNLQGMSYGNGAGAAYQYDARNRLTNLVWNLGANPLAAFGYAVNATGQRTASTETVSGTSRSYQWSYDQLSRLTNEVISGSGTVGYTFDAVGNRKSRTSTVAQVLGMNSSFTPNDWLASDGYDANGNTTNSASNVYQYDVMNRLTNAVVNGNTIQLTYDGDGNRVKKVVNGVITRYLVDDRNPSGYAQVVEEFTGLTLSKVYTYGLALISQRQVSSGAVNYYGTDGHGSTRFLMDTSGNVTDTYAYDAYGILTAKTGTTPNNYLYCCQQWDSDLGMYYLRARYLNPNTGRFWSRDLCDGTEIAPSSLHKYLYCQNNPIDMIDPSGFWGTIPKFPVHQMAIDDELSFLPESDRKILRDEQVNVDKHQDASESYMHAMRDGEHYQSVTSAKNEANSFVRQHINMARLFQNRGNREKAMSELGQAIHTLQDSTSPSHHGFKPWYNYFLGEYDPNEWVHAGREGINPGPGSWLYKATRRGYDYFNNRVPLTSNIDFFDKLGGDGVVDEVIGAAKRAARNATHYQAPSIMLQMSVFGSFGY